MRLDAVLEERERIAVEDAPHEKTGALMDKLDGDIDEMTRQIDNMNESLERLQADTSAGRRD